MTDRNPTEYRLADAIIDNLIKRGITGIYGAPGTSELALVTAAANRKLPYFTTLQDTIAVGMADGFSRNSGQIGVANLHATQGLLNAAGFIRVALRDNIPLLILAGAPSTEYDLYEPNHFLQGIEQCLSAICKWHWTLQDAEQLNHIMDRAVSISLSPPCGPVVIRIPQNVLERTTKTLSQVRLINTPQNTPREIHDAADCLLNAQHPTIFAGYGAQHSVDEIEKLAEILGAPVISEALNRGPQIQNIYSRSNHPFHMGFFNINDSTIIETLQKTDVLLLAGGKAFYPRIISASLNFPTVIHLVNSPESLNKDCHADMPLWGTIKETLQVLVNQITTIPSKNIQQIEARRNSTRNLVKAHQISRTTELENVDLKGSPITGLQLVKSMNEALRGDAILVDDSQSFSYYLKRYYEFKHPYSLFGSMASHLGWALPAALGVKQSAPDSFVVCTIGDNSFAYSLQALQTASEFQIPVLIIVANNNGAVSLKQESLKKFGTSNLLNEYLSIDPKSLNCVEIAKSFGLKGFSIDSAESLTDIIESAVQQVKSASTSVVLDIRMSNHTEDWHESWYVPDKC